ncbi:MAG: M23 family metallopeptidase, partial [Oscillospiraceae bacterium]
IMSMVLTSPFNFDDEKIIAIEQLVYQPPTTEDVVFKGKLPMPCNGYVSSPYGDRIDPINGKRFFHTGIDLVPQHRASLIAVADGTVVNVTTKIGGDYGNNVTIKHNIDGKTLYTFYAHCHSILVQVGTEVKQGDVVAIEGGQPNVDNNPGRSTGAHLHFEIRKSQNGNTVNPADYLFNDTD